MSKPVVFVLTLVCAGGAVAAVAAQPRDRDGDRLPDRWERRHGLSTTKKSAAGDPDRDRLRNKREFRLRLNPRRRDTDRDGLGDGAEIRRYKTNPRKADTDGDGVKDGTEVQKGTNPRRKDSDGDGHTDRNEIKAGTDPADPTSYPAPATPTTVSPSPSPSEFPNAGNTGVPAAVTLAPYTGPCTFRASDTNVTIDGKNVLAACGALVSNTPLNLTIRNSLVPRVEVTDNDQSLTITDSEVRAGSWFDGALWGHDINATRVEVTGGQHSVHCMDDCTVTDSWLHGQYNPAGQGYHTNAFITNGGRGMVLRHNTLHCDSILNSTNGGCTADVSLFGDFGPVSDVLVENNLLKANASSISYCAYGGYQPSKPYPVATYIRFINNVFERGPSGRCGVYGPVTAFQTGATGNVWTGNKYPDGTVIPATRG